MMCGDRWLETGSPWEVDEMTDREQFEKVFPVPVSMVWNGFTYAIVDAHEISSCWDYQLRWETWQAARATPALPDGMAIVPVEPSEEMIDYAERMDWSIPDSRAVVINIWQAMLAAAKEKGE